MAHCPRLALRQLAEVLFARCAVACLLTATMVATAGARTPDVRVLIDVSGSMKQTDPDNMRIPALRLLIDLLPTGSRAAIWTFGRYANMQVPLNPVTPAWRNRAIEQAGQIYSRGSFTNIEAGIKRSTLDWTKPSPLHDRHVILLTDGVIALPRGQEASAQSRANLLGAELERLRAVGAAIHTIGLSQLADTQLLTRLSALSGGHYIEADSADLLRHAFLRVLEHVAGLNNLPLVGARFRVDKDIDAIALLIVRGSPESPAPELRAPAGRIVSAAMAQGLDVPVRWETQGGYHVVTITSPVVGTWEVHTTEDPDNRVIGRSGIRLRAVTDT